MRSAPVLISRFALNGGQPPHEPSLRSAHRPADDGDDAAMTGEDVSSPVQGASVGWHLKSGSIFNLRWFVRRRSGISPMQQANVPFAKSPRRQHVITSTVVRFGFLDSGFVVRWRSTAADLHAGHPGRLDGAALLRCRAGQKSAMQPPPPRTCPCQRFRKSVPFDGPPHDPVQGPW